jgi:hypothetical protein
MKVIAKACVHDQPYDESTHPSLTIGKTYTVVGISDTWLRLIDDYGEPVLFEPDVFDVIDDSIPDTWIFEYFTEDGETYFHADPSGLHERGFYEDYFDGHAYAIKRFKAYCAQNRLPMTGFKTR